jgi:hypothetical protein
MTQQPVIIITVVIHPTMLQSCINDFFHLYQAHANNGRMLLEDLKQVAEVDCDGSPEVIRDLFLQDVDLTVAIIL